MARHIILTLLLFTVWGCSQKSAGGSAKQSDSQEINAISPSLIFQSGFEPDIRIINQNSKSAEIIGTDQSLDHLNNWDNDLEQHLNIGYFNIQYEGGDQTQRLAEIVDDPTGSKNEVIKFWIKEANVNDKKGRVQANVYDNNGLKAIDYSIRLFIPEDFEAVKNAPFDIKWLTLMEFWNNANWMGEDYQFRISVDLQKRAKWKNDLHLAVKGQTQNIETGKWENPYLWESQNQDFVVPIGKWMVIDVKFVEGNAKNGKFKLSITPDNEPTTIVHDITNFTHHPEDPNPNGLTHFNPFKLYTSRYLIDHVTKYGKLLHVYWDDFTLSITKGNY